MLPARARGDQIHIWPRLAYVSSLAFSACVGSLLLIVGAQSRFSSGEAWIEVGVLWAFSIPAAIVLSACSWFIYPAFRRAAGVATPSIIYVVNLASVAIGAPVLTYMVILLAVATRK